MDIYCSMQNQLLNACNVLTIEIVDYCEEEKGIYLIYYRDGEAMQILKIGMAIKGKDQLGIKRRLKVHLSSHASNSQLARYLKKDSALSERSGYDLRQRTERQKFICRECFFKILATPLLSNQELYEFERYLESNLKNSIRYLRGKILS